MKRWVLIGFALVGFGGAGVGAVAEPAPPARSVRIQFLPPDFEAVYSLAVFDRTGVCVRHLRSLASPEEFEKALDGLALVWDGRDDQGVALPPAQYHVKGYAVPMTTVQGVAFHFNDWVTDKTDLRPTRILDIGWASDGSLLALCSPVVVAAKATTDGPPIPPQTGALLKLAAPGDSIVAGPIPPPDARQFSVATPGISYLAEGGVACLVLAAQGIVNSYDFAGKGSAISLNNSRMLVGAGRSVMVIGLDGKAVEPVTALPGEGQAITALTESRDAGLVALTGDGMIWKRPEPSAAWEQWKLEGLEAPRDLAFSEDGSLWIADGGAATAGIKQVGADGVPGVWIPVSEGGVVPVQLAVSTPPGKLAVLEEGPGSQVVRVLEARPGQDPPWEETQQKEIVASPEFGLRAGVLVPDAGGVPSDHARIRIAENPLEPANRRALDVFVRLDNGGVVLGDLGGIPLVRIEVQGVVKRVALLRPDAASDGLRVFAGDGSVVAEYEVAGLERTATIDCGEYTLGPVP